MVFAPKFPFLVKHLDKKIIRVTGVRDTEDYKSERKIFKGLSKNDVINKDDLYLTKRKLKA